MRESSSNSFALTNDLLTGTFPNGTLYWESGTFDNSNKSIFQTTQQDYEFEKCSWERCTGEPGGAITLAISSSSLSVRESIFKECDAIAANAQLPKKCHGGAISAQNLACLVITQCVFLQCHAPQQVNNDAAGGMYAVGIQRVFSLSSSVCLLCSTGSSGGGIFFRSQSTLQLSTEIVHSCILINCTARGSSPDGGGLCLWENFYTFRCLNNLFYGCYADYGGGLNFNFSKNSESSPIRFCFFNRNTADVGNDVAFLGSYTLVGKLLLHCFSTSNSKRVGYYNTEWHTDDFNWLPMGTLQYLKTQSGI